MAGVASKMSIPNFSVDIISEDDIENLINEAIPDKTKSATKYGIKLFTGKKDFYLFFFLLTNIEMFSISANFCKQKAFFTVF